MSKPSNHSPPPISLEELSFLRAIWEAPKDDAPRLIYADWLEENPETCSRCHGSGEVGITFLYSNPKKPTEPTDRLPCGCTTCNGSGMSDRRQNIASLLRQDVELRRCKDNRKRHAVIMEMFRDRLRMTQLIGMPIPMITTDLGSMGKTLTNLGLWEDISLQCNEYRDWVRERINNIIELHTIGLKIPHSWLVEALHLKRLEVDEPCPICNGTGFPQGSSEMPCPCSSPAPATPDLD